MLIRWHTDNDPTGNRLPAPLWPEDWPPPGLGDTVTISDGTPLKVTAVDWFPHGEDEGDEPFVYVVIHQHQIA